MKGKNNGKDRIRETLSQIYIRGGFGVSGVDLVKQEKKKKRKKKVSGSSGYIPSILFFLLSCQLSSFELIFKLIFK